MNKSKCEICKVFVVKNSRSTYYVQRMPGLYGNSVRYVVMKDRKRYITYDYQTEKQAVITLLNVLEDNYKKQTELF